MKLIGLIGGATWVSTLDYYRVCNQLVAERLGGLHSARLVIHSLDFEEMAEAQHHEDWTKVGDILIGAARSLEAAGAELFLIGANTLHIVYDRVVSETGLPFVHIVDAVGREAVACEFQRVGLLGTRFTMEESFYRERLEAEFGLEVLTPAETERQEIHRIIYEELSHASVTERSRGAVISVVRHLAARGAQAVILGCTELPLLFRVRGGGLLPASQAGLPLLDALVLHCLEAVRAAL